VGKIGDLSGRPNTATVPKHADVIIIGDFAKASGDSLYEDRACQMEKIRIGIAPSFVYASCDASS